MEGRAQLQESTEEQAALFSALSDPTRLRLLKHLQRQRRPGALCVNALAGLLGVSQSAVSQHLRVLKGIGLVKGRAAAISCALLPQPGCAGEVPEAHVSGPQC
jgi:DNA-binding transcriptional ArsR family regulator